MLSVEHKILMDLVTHYDHIIFAADRRNLFQLLFCPHTSHRIVRRAEQKQFYMILFYFLLKILKIYMVLSVLFQFQCIIHNSASVVCDHFTERIVNRLLDDNCVSRLCERLYCHRERKYHARGFHQPVFFHMPAMLLLHPCRNCLKIFFLYLTVSKNSMCNTFLDRLCDLRCHLEIHISHPERKHIFRSSASHCEIIFQTICIFSIYYNIKIDLF